MRHWIPNLLAQVQQQQAAAGDIMSPTTEQLSLLGLAVLIITAASRGVWAWGYQLRERDATIGKLEAQIARLEASHEAELERARNERNAEAHRAEEYLRLLHTHAGIVAETLPRIERRLAQQEGGSR